MRLSSLSDLKKKEEDEGKRNELFAGGLDQRGGGSGLAVVGPPNGSGRPNLGGANRGSIFDSLVQRATQDAQEDDGEGPRQLGENNIRITLYRNGFTVDDGPLRDLESPENKRFLELLNMGRIPPELLVGRDPRTYNALDVGLTDKRGEDYVPPPYVAFGGTANVLSSGSTASASSTFSAATLSSIPPSASEDNMINILVRTHDNKRLKIRISGNATVNQLAAQVVRESGNNDPSLRFTLSAGFPPKELTDGNQSVSSAGLAGASVTMKKL